MGFSWPKYLEHCKAKAAPVKLFKDPFPYSKNQFRVGMKLEGIDPEHPSRYCVLTIVEVVGELVDVCARVRAQIKKIICVHDRNKDITL